MATGTQAALTAAIGPYPNVYALADYIDSRVTAGAPSAALSAVTAATAGHTIANGNNAQVWQWSVSTASRIAFSFTESAASTGATTVLVNISTLAASTASPLSVSARGTRVLAVNSAGLIIVDTPPTADPHVNGALWSNSGVVTVSAG